MSEQTGQRELRALIEREQVVALVDHCVTTLVEPSSFDEDWASAHRMVMARWERTVHFSTNHLVELHGEHAHLTARLMAIHVHPGENPPDPLIAANVLDADAVLTSNRWRFERFAHRTLWRTGRSPAEIQANQK
jgi:hypothetical protein